jgi:cyclopropane fatty-acyl-phospholipid synthase-like methyltransferase
VTDNASDWDRYSAAYQAAAHLPTDVVSYGSDIPTEADFKLLGNLSAKRVLDLGCGGGQSTIAFARQGAIATGIDFSTEQITFARQLAESQAVKAEFRIGDLADLAFLRGDSVDAVFSADAFGYVEDLGRVFRQVHRVLKVGAPLVFSLTHPARQMIDEDAEQPLLVRRAYFDRNEVTHVRDGVELTEYPHSFADLAMGLIKSSYRIEAILEPEPLTAGPRSLSWREAYRYVPRTIIFKARKSGD